MVTALIFSMHMIADILLVSTDTRLIKSWNAES